MKIYVWQQSGGYAGCLLVAIAESGDRARELITEQLGYTHPVLAEPPYGEHDLSTEETYVLSFG